MMLLKSVKATWDSLAEAFPSNVKGRDTRPVTANEVYVKGVRTGIVLYRGHQASEIITPVEAQTLFTYSAVEDGTLEELSDDIKHGEDWLLGCNSKIYPTYEVAVKAAIRDLKRVWDEWWEWAESDPEDDMYPRTFEGMVVKNVGGNEFYCPAMRYRFVVHAVHFEHTVEDIEVVMTRDE